MTGVRPILRGFPLMPQDRGADPMGCLGGDPQLSSLTMPVGCQVAVRPADPGFKLGK
jgi:hypothetical protein